MNNEPHRCSLLCRSAVFALAMISSMTTSAELAHVAHAQVAGDYARFRAVEFYMVNGSLYDPTPIRSAQVTLNTDGLGAECTYSGLAMWIITDDCLNPSQSANGLSDWVEVGIRRRCTNASALGNCERVAAMAYVGEATRVAYDASTGLMVGRFDFPEVELNGSYSASRAPLHGNENFFFSAYEDGWYRWRVTVRRGLSPWTIVPVVNRHQFNTVHGERAHQIQVGAEVSDQDVSQIDRSWFMVPRMSYSATRNYQLMSDWSESCSASSNPPNKDPDGAPQFYCVDSNPQNTPCYSHNLNDTCP